VGIVRKPTKSALGRPKLAAEVVELMIVESEKVPIEVERLSAPAPALGIDTLEDGERLSRRPSSCR